MTQEYVIADASIKYMNARNPLEESILYVDDNTWVRSLEKAKKFADASSAVEVARKLNTDLPVKVLLIQNEGNRIGVGEIKF